MKLLIIRHGDPDYANDCLTEKGKVEVQCLANMLKDETIDYIYCSPLGRAKLTSLATEKVKNMQSTECAWLREFHYKVDLPNGEKNHLIWDLLPSFYYGNPKLRDEKGWIDFDFMKNGKIDEYYNKVIVNFDNLLEKHGYKRNGKGYYDAVNSNKDTVAIFCHFGMECILLSRLLNISPIVLLQGFCSAPSGVTTVYTEERIKGEACFRIASFGEITHLYINGEEPSLSARFREVYSDGDNCDM